MSITILQEKWDWKTSTIWDFLSLGNFPSAWGDFFDDNEVQDILKIISEKIQTESNRKIIYPSLTRVFRVFSLPLQDIKVITLGMDPYHNGNAVGLCFSVPPGRDINPSLRNIYDELENEGFSPKRNGDLSHWAKQGCFMLNSALTVEKGEAGSHIAIWAPFTKKLITYISRETKNIAWLLMGEKALLYNKYINLNKGHTTFITSHPSPFSAHRALQSYPAFLGSNVFLDINAYLETVEKEKIAW